VAEGDETNNTAYLGTATLTVTTKSGGGGGGGCALSAAPLTAGGALGWALPYLALAAAWLAARRRRS
jgi:hypothetical protein